MYEKSIEEMAAVRTLAICLVTQLVNDEVAPSRAINAMTLAIAAIVTQAGCVLSDEEVVMRFGAQLSRLLEMMRSGELVVH